MNLQSNYDLELAQDALADVIAQITPRSAVA
jgi:hypothetical protein